MQHKDKVALSPGEFAAIFGKSQTWGYRQLYSGKVKAMTGYGRIMIPASEVDRVLSEAGRYLGQNRPVENISAPPSPSELKERQPRPSNPWRKAIQSRKDNPSILSRKNNTRRAAQRLSSKRSSALRKLNKR